MGLSTLTVEAGALRLALDGATRWCTHTGARLSVCVALAHSYSSFASRMWGCRNQHSMHTFAQSAFFSRIEDVIAISDWHDFTDFTTWYK